MPFAALADEFHSDPKTVKAGLDGTGLYARALSYCCRYLTDGFVPLAWAAEIARPAVRRKVTAAGLWVEVKGGEHYEYIDGSDTYTVDIAEPGFFIPDYLEYRSPARRRWDREALWKRFEGLCYLCGNKVPFTRFHIEHVVPLARGGKDDLANLNIAHPSCNLRKGAKLVEELA